MPFDAAGATDSGRVRLNNEDAFFCDAQNGIFIVADGMGGHNSGEVASSLAVGMVKDSLIKKSEMKSASSEPMNARYPLSANNLALAVQAANSLVYEKGQVLSKDAGMGTTIVCAWSDGKTLAIAHVGDSRLYLFRNGILSCLTEDHSVAQDQVRKGLISEEEASRSNLQNLLTRAIGSGPDVQVDASEHPLFLGDLILLVSDGLTKMLPDAEIAATLSINLEPVQLVSLLISKACDAGGVDNVTVIVARASGNDPSGSPGQ
jgi:protein phosphatase